MTIAAGKQMIFRGMLGLVMVLVRQRSNNRLRVWEKVQLTVFYFECIFIRGYNPQYTNFLSLCNNESASVSVVQPSPTSQKQGEIKTVPIITRLAHSMKP